MDETIKDRYSKEYRSLFKYKNKYKKKPNQQNKKLLLRVINKKNNRRK